MASALKKDFDEVLQREKNDTDAALVWVSTGETPGFTFAV